MTSWECKRCFLQTSADHKPADCISALRTAFRKAIFEVKQLTATVEELRAHQPKPTVMRLPQHGEMWTWQPCEVHRHLSVDAVAGDTKERLYTWNKNWTYGLAVQPENLRGAIEHGCLKKV